MMAHHPYSSFKIHILNAHELLENSQPPAPLHTVAIYHAANKWFIVLVTTKKA